MGHKKKKRKSVVSLVGGNIIDLHRAGEACVCDPRYHKDLVSVDGDAKQGAGRLQRGQVLPLKLRRVVDADSSRAFPASKSKLSSLVMQTHPVNTVV